MFSLRIISLLCVFAFTSSDAFQAAIVKSDPFLDMETDQKSFIKSNDHNKVNILFKDDGQIDLMLPFHRTHHFDNDQVEREAESAPLLMKRGKGKGKGWKHGGRWKGRGGYGGYGKPWKYGRGGYNGPGGYNGGNGYSGPGGPGDW